MPKLFQINVTANWGSTGMIAEMCNQYAAAKGWDVYFAYGRYSNPSKSSLIKICNQWEVYEHYIENILFDAEGLASRRATYSLVKKISKIQPDIVHLHNLHDHWLNYPILFNYLNNTNIKVIWTFHDFWAVTGHCSHFVKMNCNLFMNECTDCPITHGKFFPFFKQSYRNFLLKKKYFTSCKNLTIVTVSEWVCENIRKSFLKDKQIYVIPNGIDTDIFKPTPTDEDISNLFSNKFIIMAVSSQWKSGSKGLDDYIKMAKMLKKDELIVLVGVTEDICKRIPKNIIGITRTNNQSELASLYTRADVICSFSSAETFGLTIIEGFACGTPAVVYNNTAPPSLISSDTGFVVPNNDYIAAYKAIQQIRLNGKSLYSKSCIELVKTKYNKNECFNKYVELYEELLNN